ncbi:hypothetical protein [Bradyrhizobium sp. SZCCHNRI20481]|uniref:hypothetical protein n=1 Tax=Bradyrhizobium sp. SZCCHNRI20481 TaxID=3057286 RepID=UPI002916292B|nr:hypothetical protein [Bradyrhizobium sp. SZCCHNRI20481]
MKRLEVLDLFELAEAFSTARTSFSAEKAKGSDIFFPAVQLENMLRKFESDQTAFPLTRDSARQVLTALQTDIWPHYWDDVSRQKLKSNAFEQEFQSWSFYSTRSKMDEFRHVLAAECRKSETYFIDKKVGFDISTLLHTAEENLHAEALAVLPSGVRDEVRSAGRCLALECYTACGFHILRGLEVVMAAYYKQISSKDKAFRSWHDYVEALTDLEQADENGIKPRFPSPKVAAMLDRMRQLDRNPLMHPSDTLDEMAADTLFKLSIVTMTELAKDMRDHAGQTEMKLVTGIIAAAE